MSKQHTLTRHATLSHSPSEDIHQAAKGGMLLITGAAGLTGAWALCCLLSAFIGHGGLALIKGYFSAITGM